MNPANSASTTPGLAQPGLRTGSATSPNIGEQPVQDRPQVDSIRERLGQLIDNLIASLPAAKQLSVVGRRGIIARYSAVLEGNFIYWMTSAYLSAKSEEARAIIRQNLTDEVRDCHPGMLRRFTMAAHSDVTDADARAVYADLARVRAFVSRMAAVPSIVTMAYFEGFIQKFMTYLANLAELQGSTEMEYTDVHGVCDIEHTAELYRALEAELKLSPAESGESMFEGVYLLQALMQSVIAQPAQPAV